LSKLVTDRHVAPRIGRSGAQLDIEVEWSVQ
jgi:hypothetical protein